MKQFSNIFHIFLIALYSNFFMMQYIKLLLAPKTLEYCKKKRTFFLPGTIPPLSARFSTP